MTRAALLACLIASVAHADEPEDAPLPAFAQPTTFVLMRLGDDGAPRCEAWTTEPGADPNHGHIVHDKLSVAYRDTGIQLDLCDAHALVHDGGSDGNDGGELDVDGARWFHDARSCAAAVAARRAVATDFSPCLPGAAPSQKALDATRARFVAVMTKGGALTVRDGDTCRAARATAGALAIDYADRVRTLRYTLDRDELEVTDDHTVATGSDGGSYGGACADDYALHVGDARVDTFGETLYLDAATCRAQVAIDARRRSWLSSTGE